MTVCPEWGGGGFQSGSRIFLREISSKYLNNTNILDGWVGDSGGDIVVPFGPYKLQL